MTSRNNKSPAGFPAKSDYERALEALTRYLTVRDHSKYELQEKLERRFATTLVQELLNEAEQRGWLGSERDVAARLVLSLEHRKKSNRFIERELRKRQLPVPSLDADKELDTMRMLVTRKFGIEKLSYEDKAKAYRFLRYRGFPDPAIEQVLNEE